MKKDVLIITNYYPPEIGAAANRIHLLAQGLREHGNTVSVVTPFPNYPHGKIFPGFKWKWLKKDNENGINIFRLWLFASNSKIKLLRFFAMLSYSFSLTLFFLTRRIPNKVIIQSPPLIVAFFSVFFLRSKKRKLILNISDLWPQAGLELGAFKKNFTYRALEKIEHFNYKNVDLILGQSNEILSHVNKIVPNKEALLYRNFPKVNTSAHLSESLKEDTTLHIVYAGLLGVAQGIHSMLNELDFSKIHLHIYGAGAELESIESFIKTRKELPITYYGSVSRDVILKKLPDYHVAIVPLLNRIHGSVPSKIFELALLGMPIIYFGGGEGEMLVDKYNLGWVAKAGDYQSLNNCIKSISPSDCGSDKRAEIIETANNNFDFDSQLKKLTNYI